MAQGIVPPLAGIFCLLGDRNWIPRTFTALCQPGCVPRNDNAATASRGWNILRSFPPAHPARLSVGRCLDTAKGPHRRKLGSTRNHPARDARTTDRLVGLGIKRCLDMPGLPSTCIAGMFGPSPSAARFLLISVAADRTPNAFSVNGQSWASAAVPKIRQSPACVGVHCGEVPSRSLFRDCQISGPHRLAPLIPQELRAAMVLIGLHSGKTQALNNPIIHFKIGTWIIGVLFVFNALTPIYTLIIQ